MDLNNPPVCPDFPFMTRRGLNSYWLNQSLFFFNYYQDDCAHQGEEFQDKFINPLLLGGRNWIYVRLQGSGTGFSHRNFSVVVNTDDLLPRIPQHLNVLDYLFGKQFSRTYERNSGGIGYY